MSIISEALKKGEDIYICAACAKAEGGVWPPGHAATWNVGKCDQCGKDDSICALSDWDWPGRKRTLDREL